MNWVLVVILSSVVNGQAIERQYVSNDRYASRAACVATIPAWTSRIVRETPNLEMLLMGCVERQPGPGEHNT